MRENWHWQNLHRFKAFRLIFLLKSTISGGYSSDFQKTLDYSGGFVVKYKMYGVAFLD